MRTPRSNACSTTVRSAVVDAVFSASSLALTASASGEPLHGLVAARVGHPRGGIRRLGHYLARHVGHLVGGYRLERVGADRTGALYVVRQRQVHVERVALGQIAARARTFLARTQHRRDVGVHNVAVGHARAVSTALRKSATFATDTVLASAVATPEVAAMPVGCPPVPGPSRRGGRTGRCSGLSEQNATQP